MSTLRLRRRRARHGFTLVELMISLVMGLLVTLAAVGLARTATNTFHEQARLSLTEMGVRSGAERLRQDLMRVSYMSTGNIALDPKVARRADWMSAAQRARYPYLTNLQGIRVFVGGSKAGTEGSTELKLATGNGLNPDVLEITGNLTTDDAYIGTIAMGGACPAGGGQVVLIDPRADSASYMLVGGGDAGAASVLAAARSAFLPADDRQFLAQVTDAMGCKHYAPVCAVTLEGEMIGVHLVGDGGRAVLYSHSVHDAYENPPGLAASCGASEGGKVSIAPVARVRWALTPSTALLAGGDASGPKFDLTRQLLDVEGAPVGEAEIVAEYAVDLKFALTLWDPTTAATSAPAVEVLDFDDAAANDLVASTSVSGMRGPQHVRSVRFRLATRASTPDRSVDLPTAPGRPYMSRYCIDGELSSCTRFARVRTIMGEVALQNQARMFY